MKNKKILLIVIICIIMLSVGLFIYAFNNLSSDTIEIQPQTTVNYDGLIPHFRFWSGTQVCDDFSFWEFSQNQIIADDMGKYVFSDAITIAFIYSNSNPEVFTEPFAEGIVVVPGKGSAVYFDGVDINDEPVQFEVSVNVDPELFTDVYIMYLNINELFINGFIGQFWGVIVDTMEDCIYSEWHSEKYNVIYLPTEITFLTEHEENDNSSESSSVATSDFCFNGSWISTYYGVESGMQYTYPLPETMLEISDEHFRIITGMDGVTAIFEGLLSKSSTYELLATVTSPLVHDELELTIRENFILIYQPETMHIRAISLYQTNEGFSDVDYFFSRWD